MASIGIKESVTKIGKISYDVNAKLGDGNSGTRIYQGTFANESVAVKRINRDCFKQAKREESILNLKIGHQNVLHFFGKEEDELFIYIALTLCKADLQKVITNTEVQSSIKMDIITILEESMKGLEFIHANSAVAHRDIKPSNILIFEDPITAEQRVMLGDFGLSKKTRPGASSFSLHSSCGTRGWKAKELLDEDDGKIVKRASVKIDIFSFGCVFYFTLSYGGHPFGKDRYRDLNIEQGNFDLKDLDETKVPGSRALIERMISSNPRDRPTATEVLNASMFQMEDRSHLLLSSRLRAQPILSSPASSSGHSSRFMESHHSSTDLTYLRSHVPITGKDWEKKIANRLSDGRIQKEDGIVVLSGTHGPITALTDKNKADPGFIQEDKIHIAKLKNDFPGLLNIELINVADYHQKCVELKERTMALNPKYIVFAFCKSDDCTCDVKLLFSQP